RAQTDGNPPPAELLSVPPVWHVGDHWDYLGTSGLWQNHTVEALDAVHGHETYRVRIDWSRPDNLGARVYTRWYDRADLGGVEEQQPTMSAEFDCDLGRLFPMANETYACSMSMRGQQFHAHVKKTLLA